MVTTLGSFGALFSAALFFLMGNGVLSTLLSLRMAIEGFPTRAIGLVMSCYFLGLLAGIFFMSSPDSKGWTHQIFCGVCRRYNGNRNATWILYFGYCMGSPQISDRCHILWLIYGC